MKDNAPDLYQSFIGPEQRAFVSSFVIPWDAGHNRGAGVREYELFKEIFAARDDDPRPWGLVSWKFEHKTQLSLSDFAAFAKERLDRGFDCVFINPMIGHEAVFGCVWEQGMLAHPGMDRIAGYLERRLPGTVGHVCGVEAFSFCNYFVATPAFWMAYFRFVESVVDLLDRESLRGTDVGLTWAGSASYERDPAATMRPFVIERLFSTFVRKAAPRALRVAALRLDRAVYERKFGLRLGTALRGLSDLKAASLRARDARGIQRWDEERKRLFESPLRGSITVLDDPPIDLLPAPVAPTSLRDPVLS